MNNNDNNNNNNSNVGGVIKAGIIGTAIGAAAGAAVIALSDKKTREKTIKKAKEFHKVANKHVQHMQKQAQQYLDEGKQMADDASGDLNKTVKKVQSEAESARKKAEDEMGN